MFLEQHSFKGKLTLAEPVSCLRSTTLAGIAGMKLIVGCYTLIWQELFIKTMSFQKEKLIADNSMSRLNSWGTMYESRLPTLVSLLQTPVFQIDL